MSARHPRVAYLLAAVVLAGLGTGVVGTWPSAGARSPVAARPGLPFDARTATAQARVLQPLRAVANAVDAVGRGRFATTYAGVRLDATGGVVDVYATDATQARRLVAAARVRAPRARWSDARVLLTRFSRVAMNTAATRLIHSPAGAELASVTVPTGAAQLVAQERPHPGRLVPLALPRLNVPVRVVTGGPALVAKSASSWASVKWEDSQPFIGGDVLTSSAHHFCTAGLPAVNSSGVPIMITAAHCFGVGTQVYTGAGTPGDYGNGRVGNLVGTVYQKVQEWDAAEIIGANDDADESDTTRYMPLTSAAYSYDGDYVCQDGQASYFLNHPTPCGIKVTDDDIYFEIDGYWARGVQGVDVRNGWGSHNGDSGGTVFAVTGSDVRQARGIISSGGADGTPNQKIVDWTEAPDIFKYYGLMLNPRT